MFQSDCEWLYTNLLAAVHVHCPPAQQTHSVVAARHRCWLDQQNSLKNRVLFRTRVYTVSLSLPGALEWCPHVPLMHLTSNTDFMWYLYTTVHNCNRSVLTLALDQFVRFSFVSVSSLSVLATFASSCAYLPVTATNDHSLTWAVMCQNLPTKFTFHMKYLFWLSVRTW